MVQFTGSPFPFLCTVLHLLYTVYKMKWMHCTSTSFMRRNLINSGIAYECNRATVDFTSDETRVADWYDVV